MDWNTNDENKCILLSDALYAQNPCYNCIYGERDVPGTRPLLFNTPRPTIKLYVPCYLSRGFRYIILNPNPCTLFAIHILEGGFQWNWEIWTECTLLVIFKAVDYLSRSAIVTSRQSNPYLRACLHFLFPLGIVMEIAVCSYVLYELGQGVHAVRTCTDVHDVVGRLQVTLGVFL